VGNPDPLERRHGERMGGSGAKDIVGSVIRGVKEFDSHTIDEKKSNAEHDVLFAGEPSRDECGGILSSASEV
jgi:hypothetical protein